MSRCKKLIEKYCNEASSKGSTYDSTEFDKNQKQIDKLNSNVRKLLDAGDDKSFAKAKELMKEVKVLMGKMFDITKVG